jgi:Oxidoreductase-like protein, N-terminal
LKNSEIARLFSDCVVDNEDDDEKITENMRIRWKRFPMRKPELPDDESCCAGGCSPCVFDHYYNQCAQWKLYQMFLKEEEEKKPKADILDSKIKENNPDVN